MPGDRSSQPLQEHKLIVMGDGGVGKSCITEQYMYGHFLEGYGSIMEDTYRKLIDVDGQQVMLDIYVTDGQKPSGAMRDHCIRHGADFILVYSIIEKSSIGGLEALRDNIVKVKDTEDIQMVIVGNKCDLEDRRMVPKEEGEQLAKGWDTEFFESSAKEKINIDEIFTSLIRLIRKRNQWINPEKPKDQGCCLLI